jgi:hypothetical protein
MTADLAKLVLRAYNAEAENYVRALRHLGQPSILTLLLSGLARNFGDVFVGAVMRRA